ncbi:MAG: TlpA family protein disulfide reductase [Bacillus sp. (in: Bacteria)]|nr:TlpA family protein disulfide reductase [Bacillus sp. (in: firmicutes)]
MKRKLQLGILFFSLFIAGAFYLSSNHELVVTQRAMTEVSEGVNQGEKATSVPLQSLTGEELSLGDFQGKKVYLFFFTTWCSICSEQWGQLEIANQEGMLDDAVIVAVNLTKLEHRVEDVRGYAQRIPFDNVTFLLDQDGEMQDLYHVMGVPVSLLINKDGIIETRVDGFFSIEKMVERGMFK